MQKASTRDADVAVEDDHSLAYDRLNMCCLNAICRQKHMLVGATLDRTDVPAGSFYLLEALRFLSERLHSRNSFGVRLVRTYHARRLSYS
jgi:hypothetical protein